MLRCVALGRGATVISGSVDAAAPCIVAGAFRTTPVTIEPLLSLRSAPPRRCIAALVVSVSLAAALAACGGGGGGGDAATVPPSSGALVTISGKAVFESVPPTGSAGLNYASASDKPVRGATVQLLSAGDTVLATSSTDGVGNYSVVLSAAQAVKVRVRAEIKRSGAGNGDRDIAVLDNTAVGNPLYVLDSALFTPAANVTQNLRAASGWGGAGYTGTRAAAPFSLLDVIYEAQAKIATVAPTVNLPPLKVFWSINNKTVGGNLATGDIGTSFFTVTAASGRSLYVLGQANVDTDEYDTHVIAHEFGHYLQNALSRDDSIGGAHGNNDKLDMRVAFSEGWGNAWSGIALGDPVYIDTVGPNQGRSFAVDVSQPETGTDRGWFSETSGQHLIWTANQTFGFAAVYSALTSLTASPAWSSLYSFAAALKAAVPAQASPITALWATQQIVAQDAYGAGETNNGGNPLNLPVYKTHVAALGVAQNYCPHADADPSNEGNKLGEIIYVRFTVAAGPRTLTLTKTLPAGAATTDPDFTLLKSDGTTVDAVSGDNDVETLLVTLPTGTHTLALSDFKLDGGRTSCFDFKVQ